LHVKASHESEAMARKVLFNEWYALPRNLDLDNVRAKYENGILSISISKIELEDLGKQVKVE